MHLVAYNYNKTPSREQQASVTLLFTHMVLNLPCPACSHHGRLYIEAHPPNTLSREDLLGWVNDFHNHVNGRLGKPQFTLLESEKAVSHWISTNGSLKQQTRWTTPVVVIVTSIVILVMVITLCAARFARRGG